MRTVTTRFQEVSARRTKHGICPGCGGAVTRSKTFTNTINPFNRNDDGSVKTAEQVRADVEHLGDVWVPDFRHARCL